MTSERLVARFVGSAGGRIFVLLRRPEKPASGRCVLFVPPFGEEMNKCRRQLALTAEALVAEGLSALAVDLYGTGDSDGEFADAGWETWKRNVAAAVEWARGQNLIIDALVATRLGCILAAESLADAGLSVSSTVFWQPVESGRQFMTQFLRLRVAASMMTPDSKETVELLKGRLERGEALEVAGYELTPELWRNVERAELCASLHDGLGRLSVVEVGRAQDVPLSPSGRRLVAEAEEHGLRPVGIRVPGEPFWAATEIVVNPRLSEVTTRQIASRT